MRKDELDEAPKYWLNHANVIGEALAQAGHPIAGNDPKKPN
jgi:hypothetical protein